MKKIVILFFITLQMLIANPNSAFLTVKDLVTKKLHTQNRYFFCFGEKLEGAMCGIINEHNEIFFLTKRLKVAMFVVNEISISPDDRYISIVSVGEGHPVLQIFDLKEILNSYEYYDKKKIYSIGFINPYPGYISVEGWNGKNIILSSSVSLDKLNKKTREVKQKEAGDEAKFEWNFRIDEIAKRE